MWSPPTGYGYPPPSEQRCGFRSRRGTFRAKVAPWAFKNLCFLLKTYSENVFDLFKSSETKWKLNEIQDVCTWPVSRNIILSSGKVFGGIRHLRLHRLVRRGLVSRCQRWALFWIGICQISVGGEGWREMLDSWTCTVDSMETSRMLGFRKRTNTKRARGSTRSIRVGFWWKSCWICIKSADFFASLQQFEERSFVGCIDLRCWIWCSLKEHSWQPAMSKWLCLMLWASRQCQWATHWGFHRIEGIS